MVKFQSGRQMLQRRCQVPLWLSSWIQEILFWLMIEVRGLYGKALIIQQTSCYLERKWLDQKKGIDRFLTSWKSADYPGIGEYSFQVNPNGSPQFFLYKGANRSWRTASWPWKSQKQLYNNSFVNNQDDIYFAYSVLDDSAILGKMLDHSGFLKALTWHESERRWKEFWKTPQARCNFFGQCGAYGTCAPTDVNGFECACLPGYEPRYPRDWLLRDGSGGCVRKRLESSLVCVHGEGFVKVENVFLPDTSAVVWLDIGMSRSDCEQECKNNCSCSAYANIYIPEKGMGCLIWYDELFDTLHHLHDRTERYDLYVRIDAIELAANIRKSNGSLEKETLEIFMPSVASAFFVLSLCFYLWIRKWRIKLDNSMEHELRRSRNGTDSEFFKLSTVSAATKNFSPANQLGQGGFGSVYKGLLPSGQEVAIKRLSANSQQGIQEFKNEFMLIAKLQHRNLVKILGCCIQGGERMLIYEYLPNKGLDSFLFDETKKRVLNWNKRFDIIVGIARGILYLHQDSRFRIIHRDLKCSNILLDAEMSPKISDFGVARIFEDDKFQDWTNRVVGTFGYMSPEYAAFGKFPVKSDVFSFGVMLLEIVSGKKNNRFDPQDRSLTSIGHVWELWRQNRALEVVDSSLLDLYHPQEALRCIQIGLLCVQEDAMGRPSMLAVVFILNSPETTIPSPRQPAFVFRDEPCNIQNVQLSL